MDHVVIGRFLALCICLFIAIIAFGIHFKFLTFNPEWSYDADDLLDDGKILLGLDRTISNDYTTTVSATKHTKHTKKPVNKTVKPVKKKPQKSKKLSPFENDCILALVSLGVKKSAAKSDVKSFLKNKNITRVEEFLQAYMKERANV